MAKGLAQHVADLVHAATNREAEGRRKAKARYIKLIHADSGTEAEVGELLAAATLLGKTAADIKADRQTVVDAVAAHDSIAALAGCETARLKLAEMHRRNAETLRVGVARLMEQHRLLSVTVDAADGLCNTDRSRREKLAALKAENFELLAAVEMPADDLPSGPADLGTLVPLFKEWESSHVGVTSMPYAQASSPDSAPVTGSHVTL